MAVIRTNNHFFIFTSAAFTEHVSISSTGPNGVMGENTEHSFTCHIGKVAPLRNLTVRWYRDDALIHTDTFHNSTRKEPEEPSAVFSFTPTRRDNGARYRCEAHMDLTPEGPQFNLSSQEYYITVQCKYPVWPFAVIKVGET